MEEHQLTFYENEVKYANQPFLKQPFGDRWEVTTWKEGGQMARRIATGLQSMGLREKAHIGIVSKNCREWIIADIAIMMAGYISVPFYPTLTGDQLGQVLDIGDVDALFVGKTEVWEDMKNGVPEAMPVVKFPHYEGNSKVDRGIDWNDFIDQHEPLQGTPSPDLDDTWTIVFTSGTTGTPKGVVHTYRTIDSTRAINEHENTLEVSLTGDNHFFSYLPLNHIAERVVVEMSCLRYGGDISFTQDLAHFAQNLKDTRPTLFFAVPRIWTKFQMGVLSKMPQSKLNTLLKIPIVSGMVKKKLLKGLGLDRTRATLTGAAPMAETQKDWYRSIGLYIFEGYGMTENCAIATTLNGRDIRPGSVGKARYSSQVKIDPDTNEILTKAPWTMIGYYKDPEKTAETIRDGWLHTGDEGRLDEDGYLFITGRVKDTFKTSKGEFIVPAPIEWEFADNSDIEQICIVGLGCPQPIALVVPSEMGQKKSKAELKASLEATLKAANAKMANYKRVSTIVITKDVWSVDNGLLTPTLKVKRNVMNQRYRDHFLNWHNETEAIVFE
ncbi:MAG: AMP-binding protein [Bacteroidota bacterium]